MLCYTVLQRVALRCAALRCAVLCCAVLCCAVLCCAVLLCAVLCCTVLHCAALRNMKHTALRCPPDVVVAGANELKQALNRILPQHAGTRQVRRHCSEAGISAAPLAV
jgi:hypothetical protein